MKNNLVLMLTSLIMFAACAGSKPKPIKNKDLPDWVLNPPKIENKFVGVGSANRGDFELSKQVAASLARDEVARAVETKVNSTVNNHMSASGMGDDISNTAFSESISKSLVTIALKGATIEKTEYINERVFVMVTYDYENARNETKAAARKIAKQEEALYNEFKARQAFDSLDKAIDRME